MVAAMKLASPPTVSPFGNLSESRAYMLRKSGRQQGVRVPWRLGRVRESSRAE